MMSLDLEKVARQRIKDAKAILGPECNVGAIERAVWALLVLEDRRGHRADIRRIPTTKLEKRAVDRVAKELRRLLGALNDPALPGFVRKLLRQEELREHGAHLEALALRSLGKPKRSAEYKRRAAMLAADLLQEHKLPLITTRRGKFCRLAAALHGNKDADLFDHCRKYRDVSFD